MNLADWFDGCKEGVFLTQRENVSLPDGAVIIARSHRSGIGVVVGERSAEYLIYDAFHETSYDFDPKGSSPCLSSTCLRLGAEELAVYTKVGLLENELLGTSQTAGYLFYGPYVARPSGNYLVTLLIDGQWSDGAAVDVASNGGKVTHARKEIDEVSLSSGKFELLFSLDHEVSDLEVRMNVSEQTNLKVRLIEVRGAP